MKNVSSHYQVLTLFEKQGKIDFKYSGEKLMKEADNNPDNILDMLEIKFGKL
jgi:hypothetical protein